LRGRLLPPGWAITQAILAGGGSYLASALLMQYSVSGGIGFAAAGTWFIGHGVMSLVQHDRERPRTSSRPPRSGPHSGPLGMPPPPARNQGDWTVVPIAHGAVLVTSGVF
jgi:hypothetical protein